MTGRVVTCILAVGLLFSLAVLGPRVAACRLPGNNQGYEPVQPIAYSHRLHAGDMQIPCLYCHFGAQSSRHAGIPPASVCMNCHKFVTASLGATRAEEELAKKQGREPRRVVSPELQKLYDALALNERMERDPARTPTPNAWVRIHQLPAFAHFDHRAHQAAGVACQTCHGPIQTMDRVRQMESLSMGWCVACHRDATAHGVNGKPVHASTDCATCHY